VSPRRRTTPVRLALGAALIALVVLVAGGRAGRSHTGLPVAEAILARDGKLIVATSLWGLFVDQTGDGGGPFRWICDEAIDPAGTTIVDGRAWASSSAGTLLVGTVRGLRLSRDGGCTWEAAPGALASTPTSTVVADGATIWAVTFGALGPNALWRSDDDARSFRSVLQSDDGFDTVAVSPGGAAIWLSATDAMTGAAVLYVSTDGGAQFARRVPTYTLAGAAPSLIRPLAVEASGVAWLAAVGDVARALLRGAPGGDALDEKWVVRGEITAVLPRAGEVLAVTTAGLVRVDGTSGAAAAIGDLAQPRCLVERGGALYACASNFPPDERVLSRSDDGARTFQRLFRFNQTAGPVACAADTPVGRTCPSLWALYAERIGVTPTGDGGTGAPDLGPSTPPAGGCSLSPR
jgi:hypothetical protein